MIVFTLDLLKLDANSLVFYSRLQNPTIDRDTGQFQPRFLSQGNLDLQSSIELNREFTRIFRTIATQSYYFGGIEIELAKNMQTNSNTIIEKLQNLQDRLVESIDRAFEGESWKNNYEQLMHGIAAIQSHESIRLVIYSNDRSVQDLPLENTKFINRLGKLGRINRSISVIFVSL